MTFSKSEQLKQRYEKKLKKAKQPSLKELKDSLQRLVNKYIRLRDKDEPCISCGKWSNKFDAGHYINQGSTGALRYNEDNIHKQCSLNCNKYLSGNKIKYRIALVKKIGSPRVELLESQIHDVKKWTREELEELKTYYKEQLSNIDKA